jgi:hypothetical protein
MVRTRTVEPLIMMLMVVVVYLTTLLEAQMYIVND